MTCEVPATHKWALAHGRPCPRCGMTEAVFRLVEAVHAVIEGDSPCRVCGVEPGEGEGRCEPGCVMDDLVVALRPFDGVEATPDPDGDACPKCGNKWIHADDCPVEAVGKQEAKHD